MLNPPRNGLLGCGRRLAVGRLLMGILIGILAVGQLSGCSRRPEFAGIYALANNDPDGNWLSESLIHLSEDGTAVMQDVSLHPSSHSKIDVKLETRSQGKWWVEGERLIYLGIVTTASTLGGEKHHGSESVRLVFLISSDGDLLLVSEDMSADDVRYVKEGQIRGSN